MIKIEVGISPFLTWGSQQCSCLKILIAPRVRERVAPISLRARPYSSRGESLILRCHWRAVDIHHGLRLRCAQAVCALAGLADQSSWIELAMDRIADNAVLNSVIQVATPKRGLMYELYIFRAKYWLSVPTHEVLLDPDTAHG